MIYGKGVYCIRLGSDLAITPYQILPMIKAIVYLDIESAFARNVFSPVINLRGWTASY
jgi:hypothetical protein